MRRVATHPRVLIIGTGPEALALGVRPEVFAPQRTRCRRPVPDIGSVPTTDAAARVALRVFSRDQSIIDLVSRHRVHEIIVAVREQRGGGVPMDELLACRIRGIPVLDLAAYSEQTRCEVPIDSLKGSWLVYGHGFVQGHARRFASGCSTSLSSVLLLSCCCP